MEYGRAAARGSTILVLGRQADSDHASTTPYSTAIPTGSDGAAEDATVSLSSPLHEMFPLAANNASSTLAAALSAAAPDALLTTAETASAVGAAPQMSLTETIEILIYTICLLIGGPLNLLSFRKLLRKFQGAGSGWKRGINGSAAASGAPHHLTLLKLHLNIADLLTMFVYTLSQIVWMITYQWYAGDLLCRICKFFHTFGFYLNSFVVACFALDRAFSTYHLNTLNTSKFAYLRVRRMLTAAWAFAFILSVPQSFIFRVVEPPGMKDFKQCTPVWTIISYNIDLEMNSLAQSSHPVELQRRDELARQFQSIILWERAYNIAHLLFVFWIPALIIVSSYVTILCLLNSFSTIKRSKSICGTTQIKQNTKQGIIDQHIIEFDENVESKSFDVESSSLLQMNFNNNNYECDAERTENECTANSGGTAVFETDMTGENNSKTETINFSNSALAMPTSTVPSKMGREASSNPVGKNPTLERTKSAPLNQQCLSNSHRPVERLVFLEPKFSTAIGRWCRKRCSLGVLSAPNNNDLSLKNHSVRLDDAVSDYHRRTSDTDSASTPLQQPVESSRAAASSSRTHTNVVGPMALQRIAKARQKTKRQAALILVAYLTFWTPYNVLAIFNAFSPKDGALREIASVTLPFLNSMIVMNPIVNPLIYGLFDRHKRSFSNGHSTQTT